MFLEYFIQARDYLLERGLKPAIVMGSPVSEGDLTAVDTETDFPMPKELRDFYLELGDAFTFVPDETENSDLVGWEQMRLADHEICNRGFGTEIEKEVKREIGKRSPRADPAPLRAEMERRKLWMPFYGFVGAGDYLCLDLTSNPPAIRFYESLVWVALSPWWDFVLAPSFTEFVQQWSRYHFLSPAGE